jgi:hypothetical protein
MKFKDLLLISEMCCVLMLLISGYMKFPDFQFDEWLYEISLFAMDQWL